jgi:hypothetical protein
VNFKLRHEASWFNSSVVSLIIHRNFEIKCRGVGVHPPLRLSSQRVHFRATALTDTSYATIYVCNEHTDYDEHRHPVPRIGTGEIPNVGPTAFEFDLPENCPFTLTPRVGVVNPNEVSTECTTRFGFKYSNFSST